MKYPKFSLLLLSFFVAYILFYGKNYLHLQDFLMYLGYIGVFLSGILYSYGFTAGFAISIFLIIGEYQNIYLAGLIGGLGALVGDLIIFRFIRGSFLDEVKKLSKEKIIRKIERNSPAFFKKYLIPVIACFIIASPLPDEIGVSLLAVSIKVSESKFYIISYVLNTIGIFLILGIGNIL